MLVEFINVEKIYKSGLFVKSKNNALRNLSFSIEKEDSLGLIGNSGCGKSSIAKILMGLIEPTSGEVLYKGKSILQMSKKRRKDYSKNVQMVFQHPENSLNPNMTIEESLLEPIKIHKNLSKNEERDKIEEALEKTKLSLGLLKRYPSSISGGEAQRIMICRALIMEAELIILDEPTSMLDVKTQKDIIDLLIELKQKENLTYLFISHDLKLARYFCNRFIIIEEGKIIEEGDKNKIFENPEMPFTKKLIENFQQLSIFE